MTEPRFGHGFADEIDKWPWEETSARFNEFTEADVKTVLAKSRRNTRQLSPEDFMVLISPAANAFLEEMAALSMHFTRERFGKTISLYIPM